MCRIEGEQTAEVKKVQQDMQVQNEEQAIRQAQVPQEVQAPVQELHVPANRQVHEVRANQLLQAEVLSFDDFEVLEFDDKKESKRKLTKSTGEKIAALKKKSLFEDAKKSISALNSANKTRQEKFDKAENWEKTMALKDELALEREIAGISQEEYRIRNKKQYDAYMDLLNRLNEVAETDEEQEICAKLGKSLAMYSHLFEVDLSLEVDTEDVDDAFAERATGVKAVDNLLYRRFSEGSNAENKTIIMKLLSLPYRDRLFIYGAIEHGRSKSVSLKNMMDYSVGYVPDGDKIIEHLKHRRILDPFRTRKLNIDVISDAMRLCEAKHDELNFLSTIDKESLEINVNDRDITDEERERRNTAAERAQCLLNCISAANVFNQLYDLHKDAEDKKEIKSLEDQLDRLLEIYQRDVTRLLVLNNQIPEAVSGDIDRTGKWKIPQSVIDYIENNKLLKNKDEFDKVARDISLMEKGAGVVGNIILSFLLISTTKEYVKNFKNSTKSDRATQGVDWLNSAVKNVKNSVSTVNSGISFVATNFTANADAITKVTDTVSASTTCVSIVTGSVVAGLGAFELGETYFRRDRKRKSAEHTMDEMGARNEKMLRLSERMSTRRKISGYTKVISGGLTVIAGGLTLGGLSAVGGVLSSTAIVISLGGMVAGFVKKRLDRTAAIDDYLEIDRLINHKYAEYKQKYHRSLSEDDKDKYRKQLRRYMMQSRGYTSESLFYKKIIEEYAERMREELFCGDAQREKAYADLARSMGIRVDKEKGYPSVEFIIKKMMN